MRQGFFASAVVSIHGAAKDTSSFTPALTKMTIDYLENRPLAVCDTECFPNAWIIGFRNMETGKIVKLAKYKDRELDRARVATIMRSHRVFTFNGLNYDLPMIMLAMSGASCEDLKRANDEIIPGEGRKGIMPWEFFDKYDLKVPEWIDHIDLFNVAPSAAQKASLKKYAGMMHSKSMMEYMHDFHKPLNDETFQICMDYLDNDLMVTSDLAEELAPQIRIRAVISNTLGVDVRSKSDAQVGEATIRHHVEKRKGGKKLYRPDIVPGPFKYEVPEYVEFQTPQLQSMLTQLARSNFVVRGDGYVQLPDMFGKKKGKALTSIDDDEDDDGTEIEGGAELCLDGLVYKMGIGGLHSQEKCQSYFEDDEYILVDRDVTSYYPNLMLRSGREPANMRGHFLIVYKGIVVARTTAKALGLKDEAESGKIQVNGLFGKTGSPWSIVYSPPMMIQTTVTGQLSIFMLIEEVVMRGWKVISANTDGFVTRVPRKDYGMFTAVVFDWECQTGLTTEEVRYRSVHSRDVNTYFALKHKMDKKTGQPTGEVEAKRKGAFSLSGRGQPAAMGLKKTPDVEICYDAVVEHLTNGTPVESTIRNCQDIRKFVTVRKVQGGACNADGEVIGKTVRFYYSDESDSGLYYIKSGNKVPDSIGAMPCMVLPDELPRDIDYLFYEREAYAIMDECGMEAIDPTLVGRTGKFLGRLPEQKTLHTVDAATGLGVCGMKRKSRRDLWVEYKSVPDTHRYCGKCNKLENL